MPERECQKERVYGGWRTEGVSAEKDSGCFVIRTIEHAGYETDHHDGRIMFEIITLNFFSYITRTERLVWDRGDYKSLEAARESKGHALADFLIGIGAREKDVEHGWSFFQEDRLFKLNRRQLNTFKMRRRVSPIKWANPKKTKESKRSEGEGMMRQKHDDAIERTRAMVLYAGGYSLVKRDGSGSLTSILKL